MQTNYQGSISKGSSALQTSTANTEIIPTGLVILNFALMNDQNCNVIINGGDSIFIRASQGIFIDKVSSCKITTSAVTFNWIGVQG